MNRPAFSIVRPDGGEIEQTVETLDRALRQVKVQQRKAEVGQVERAKVAPPGMQPLLGPGDLEQLHCHLLGLEIRPDLPEPDDRQGFPAHPKGAAPRALERREAVLLRVLAHRDHPSPRRTTTRSGGERSSRRSGRSTGAGRGQQRLRLPAAGDAGRIAEAAWRQFRSKPLREGAEVHLPARCRSIRACSSAISSRSRSSASRTRPSPRCSATSRRSSIASSACSTTREHSASCTAACSSTAGPARPLLKLAEDLLDTDPVAQPRRFRQGARQRRGVRGAGAGGDRALPRALSRAVASKAEVRDDVSGLMVSRGNLLIGKPDRGSRCRGSRRCSSTRSAPTSLTYFNGQAQPFKQLYAGLPEYEELQEGLAVLAEYLVGGLSRPRLRLLAARVVAARSAWLDGATFVERLPGTGSDLRFRAAHGLHRSPCGSIAAVGSRRTPSTCGASSKLLDYLKGGGELEPLYVGKIAVRARPDHRGTAVAEGALRHAA